MSNPSRPAQPPVRSMMVACTLSYLLFRRNTGRWTQEEHEDFLKGLRQLGRNWCAIHELYVPTRNDTQIRTHAQKYFRKIDRGLSFPVEVRGFALEWFTFPLIAGKLPLIRLYVEDYCYVRGDYNLTLTLTQSAMVWDAPLRLVHSAR